MGIAVKVEGLGKRFLLGQTFENTLSSRVGGLLRGRWLRASPRQEEFWALRDVDFEIEEGEAVGIIGGNGAGKSTLLKILSRITPPTNGRARVKGRLSSLLEVGTGFHPELTGRENIFLNGAILGMRKAEVERKFDEIVAFAGVEKFIDTPVKRYSSGMYVRLAFAVAAHLEPDVLIIDEVLAVGDAEFQKRCMGKMGEVAREGRTVLFVSHNMAAVQKLCAHALWLKKGSVLMMDDAAKVVGEYSRSASAGLDNSEASSSGYRFLNRAKDDSSADAYIASLQLLDRDGKPVSEVGTWDFVRFRITFDVKRAYQSFSAVIQVSTVEGVPLILTSTSPDHSVSFGVAPGRYVVDCDFDQFPLAQGEYSLGLGLAIPCIEYVWRDDAVCRLDVSARDTYLSGRPPSSSRYLVATPHHWTAPRAIDLGEPEH